MTGAGDRAMRVGQGLDVHRFAADRARPLVLGGVTVAPDGGLEGHSDADVVSHALADALLGAAGLGDLGRHFPDNDERHAGADSLGLLSEVLAMVGAAGWRVVNADCTVVAQSPRLAPFVDEMQSRLGDVLGAPVSVKATTAEGMGALGRSEGMACTAVVLLCEAGTS